MFLSEIWRSGGLASTDWVKGKWAVIRGGQFEGCQGIFDVRLSGRSRVRVLLEIQTDRHVTVEADAELLEKG